MTSPTFTQSLKLAYISYGSADDSMFASGVPHYLHRGFSEIDGVELTEIMTRPSAVARLLIKLASFRAGRVSWERNYLHGRLLPRVRSANRTRGVRRASPLDVAIHVRTWYSPMTSVPYTSFIDATVTQVRGYDPSWDLTDAQFAREVAVEGDFYRGALAVYTASHAAGESLIHDYGVDPSRIVRVGAGTTLPGLDTIEPERIAQRIASPKLLFVGKDPDRKGLPELIAAFTLLRAEFPELTLTIVGPTEPREEYRSPGVRWLGLVTDKEALAQNYADATVFCLPAHQESFGLVVPEALAHGVPCVVSSTGELPRLVEHGVTGAVLPEVSPEAIAASIKSLLTDEQQYERMSAHAHRAGRTYSWPLIAELMRDDMRRRLGS